MAFANLDQLLREVQPLGELFRQSGFRLYLVGGIVRDQHLDFALDSSADIDLTTDATPDKIKQVVAPLSESLWTQGERFGTIGLRSKGRPYEITTHRAETYSSDSRKPLVVFGDDIAVDLSRRDFTVNAMAIEVPSGALVDPFNGAEDLARRVLRTPLSPEISFEDDPLRMLRAARFGARFGLAIDPSLVAAATALRERIRIVSIERIGNEIERLLALDRCAQGLDFLATTGVLSEVLCYGEPDLIEVTTERAANAVALVGALDPPWRLRLAGLLCGIYGDASGVSAAVQRLRLANADQRWIVRVVTAAASILASPDPTRPRLRRWAADAHDADGSLQLAAALANADPSAAVGEVEAYRAAYQTLAAEEDLADSSPLHDGEAIMARLAIGAGPAIGEAVTFLREERFDRGALSLEEEQAALDAWWRQRSPDG